MKKIHISMSQIELNDKLVKSVLKILILNKDIAYTKEELYNTLIIDNKNTSINKKELDNIFEKLENYNEHIYKTYINNKECLIWTTEVKKIEERYINDIKNKKRKVTDYINGIDNIIHYLTKKQDIESLKILEKIESNIDWMKKNKEGKTCLDISKEIKNTEIYDFMNEKRYKKQEYYYQNKYNLKIYLIFFMLGILCMMDTPLRRYINNELITYNTTIYEKIMYNNTANIIISFTRNIYTQSVRISIYLFNMFITINRYLYEIEIVKDIAMSIYF